MVSISVSYNTDVPAMNLLITSNHSTSGVTDKEQRTVVNRAESGSKRRNTFQESVVRNEFNFGGVNIPSTSDVQKCHDIFGADYKTDSLTLETAKKENCQKRLPKALIAGAFKSGTGTLIYFLSVHPEIVGCVDVEINYFSYYYHSAPISWYRNKMPCSYSHQITIEKSPSYFLCNNSAKRVKDTDPNMKIIFIVKDPIVRAESQFVMPNLDYHGRSFEELVTMKDINNRTVVNKKVDLIRWSDYASSVKPWLKYFDRKQILFLDGHKFMDNPTKELKQVEKFLGVKPFFTPDRFWFNETKGMYCIVQNSSKQCMPPMKGIPHKPYPVEVRKLLENYFKPINEKFFRLINKRFDWGY